MKPLSKSLLKGVTLVGFALFSLSATSSAQEQSPEQSNEYIIFDVKGSAEGITEKFVLGSVLKDGDKIEIPENAEIRLLDKAGEVVVLTGPLIGTVANEDGNSQKAKDRSNALQVIAKLMFGETNLVNNLGAARALQSVQTDKGKIQPWVPVISKPGTYCLTMSDPVFGRAVALSKAKVTVISGSEIFKEKIWNENEHLISIADMVEKTTDRYTLFLSSHTTESSIHLLDRTGMNTTEQIAWMAERGCKAQAVQLLDEVSEAANKDG